MPSPPWLTSQALSGSEPDTVAPGDELIQHPVHFLLVPRTWSERRELIKIVHQREHHLCTDGRDHEFRHNLAQVRAGAAGAAVAHQRARFVAPPAAEKVEGVLERAGRAVVVLGSLAGTR